ncbi:MAG: cytochrome P450 [Opitutaceae bacterium]
MSRKQADKTYDRGEIKGHPIFGCLNDIRFNSLDFFERCSKEGDIVRFRLAHRRVYGVHHPDLVKKVLLTDYECFVKEGIYSRLRPVFRKGLITSMGALWKKQRRTMQPMFSKKNMATLISIIESEVCDFRDQLLERAEQGEKIDLFEEMLQVTLNIVTSTMFSSDVSDKHKEVSEHVYFLNQYLTKSLYSLLPPIKWLPTKYNRQYKLSMKALDTIILDLVESRRKSNDFGTDLLGMLLSSTDPETGESMSTEQVRDEAVTMFIAGHETTATALTWTYYLMNKNPAVRDAVNRLATEVVPVDGRGWSFDLIQKLDLFGNVFMESLRAKPAVIVLYREAAHDCELGGFQLKKGDTVYVSPYISNRDARHWEAPEEFRPDRFSELEGGHKNKFLFFPFGAGPRSCIGSRFAMLEAQMILGILGQSLSLVSDDPAEAVPEPLVTMKPRDPLMMDVVPH